MGVVFTTTYVQSRLYSIQHYVIRFVSDFRHDITEILLNVALNTITLTLYGDD